MSRGFARFSPRSRPLSPDVIVYVRLFGGASIDGPAGPLSGRATQRHRLGLLALLAVQRRLTRDKLIAYLWPSSGETRGRRLLSDSVYRINQAFDGEAIVAAGDELRLDASVVDADVIEFRNAMTAGEYEVAAALYAGPFLDGFFIDDADEFERWVDASRTQFSAEHAAALAALADAAQAAGKHHDAVDWSRRLATADPYSARHALRLMTALAAAGDRVAAIRHARIYTLMLEQELGLEPDPDVAAFAERLVREPPSAARAHPEQTAIADSVAHSDQPPSGRLDVDAPAPDEPVADPPAADVHAAGPPPPPAVRRIRRSGLWRAAAALALAVAGSAAWLATRQGNAESPIGHSAIAVLPFADLSQDGDHEYFADGITEELINALAGIDGVLVSARTSAFAFKGRSVDVREVGRQLGAGSILEGSVRRSGDRVRITAQLIDAATGYHLWSQTYERPMEDVFDIQDQIAAAIVGTVRGTILGETEQRHAGPPDRDVEAYQLYLKGRYNWHRRTGASLRLAAEMFEQAVARAPDYAQAHVGLGDAYAVLGFYEFLPPAEAFPRAQAAAVKALELDPTLARAHATLGYVALYHEWQWSRAEAEFRRAIELAPTYSTAHQWYANFLTAMGRFDEAELAMQQAQQLDPLSLIANAALGWVHFFARNYEEAIAQCLRTLELDPGFELAHLWQGMALEQLGRHDEAAAAIATALRLGDGSAITRAALARSRALQGREAEARAILDGLTGSGQAGYLPAYDIARVFLALGQHDHALKWLERAFVDRSHSMVFLRVDPAFDDLRTDPRFLSLVERTGLNEP
jgi:TolB-like protein/DNA-binding SARP family transcriptional activator/Flp pilus assembly protein TadD